MFTAKYNGYDIDLYRSREQRWFAGVCGGIAENMQWSVTGVRICTVFLFFFTGSFALFAYIAAVFLLASRPRGSNTQQRNDETYRQNRASERTQFGGHKSQSNLKDKVFHHGASASNKLNEIRERLSKVDQRIRSMEEHVTSRKFQFEREMRRS